MTPVEPTEAQVDAILAVLSDEVGLPHMARSRDFIAGPNEPPAGPERDAALAALRAADDDADARNRDFARRVARAVLTAPATATGDHS